MDREAGLAAGHGAPKLQMVNVEDSDALTRALASLASELEAGVSSCE